MCLQSICSTLVFNVSLLTLCLSPASVLGLHLSRVLGMAGNKGRASPRTRCPFFTCTQRFFCFPNSFGNFFWSSFELLLACQSLLERDAQIWVCCFKQSLRSTGKSRIITLQGCSSLVLLTPAQSIIPPAHSLLDSSLARYLHTASLLLFIPSYVLIFCICPAESLSIDCRPLL